MLRRLAADAQIVANQAADTADNSPGNGIGTKCVRNHCATKRANTTALKVVVKTS